MDPESGKRADRLEILDLDRHPNGWEISRFVGLHASEAAEEGLRAEPEAGQPVAERELFRYQGTGQSREGPESVTSHRPDSSFIR